MVNKDLLQRIYFISITVSLMLWILNALFALWNPWILLVPSIVIIFISRKQGEMTIGLLPAMFLLSAMWAAWIHGVLDGRLYEIVDTEELLSLQRVLSALPLVGVGAYLYYYAGLTWEDFKEFPNYLKDVLGLNKGVKRFKGMDDEEERVKEYESQQKQEEEYRKAKIGVPTEDLVFAYSLKGNKPVKLKNIDRYLHTLVTGPTGAGKTKGVLEPMVEQEVKAISNSLARGIARGLTLVEPKGDFVRDVYDMANYYKVPVIRVDPLWEHSAKFNPLEGHPTTVAEATRTVLQATFGRQEAFFAMNQELASRNTVLLLKYIHGNNITMTDLSRVLRDPELLRKKVEVDLAKLCDQERLQELTRHYMMEGDRKMVEHCKYLQENIERMVDLSQFFQKEILGPLKEKSFQFALGLRLQIENLTGNEQLDKIINHPSDIHLDDHLNKGGILIVNTAYGDLGKLGDIFGQFLVMHLQNAVFRRKGSEDTRPRHSLIMDEAHRYINPDFERLLAMGRGFRCECILALQNTAQLIIDGKTDFRDSVVNLCRNQIVYGGMDSKDAQFFAREFGEEKVTKTTKTYSGTPFFKKPWEGIGYRESEDYEPRFTFTDLMELPARHVVYKVVEDSKPMPPGMAVTRLSEWHKKGSPTQSGLLISGMKSKEQRQAETEPSITDQSGDFDMGVEEDEGFEGFEDFTDEFDV